MYHNHIQVPQDQSKSRICVSKLCPLRPQEKVPVPIEQLGKQAQMSSNVCSTQCSIITLLHVTECECRNDCRLEISGTLAVFEQKSGDQATLLTFNMTVFCATHHTAMSAWHWIRMTVFLRGELQSMLLETSNPEKTLQSISSKPVTKFGLFLWFAHSPK